MRTRVAQKHVIPTFSIFLGVIMFSVACRGLAVIDEPVLKTTLAGEMPATELVQENLEPSQSTVADPDKVIKFRHISLEQGLSQSSVFDINQDGIGFIWFGTQDGLNKYDGYRFTVYRPDPGNENSLSHHSIWAVHTDEFGDLWIGTNGNGLDKLNRQTGEFTHYRHNSTDSSSISYNVIYSIYEDSSGDLWLGTGRGLNKFDRKSERFIHYQHDSDDPESLSYDVVRAIYEDRYGALWVGTERGLNRYNPKAEGFTRYMHNPDDDQSLSGNRVLSIFEDHLGDLWIGTGSGLNRYDRETDGFINYFHHDEDPQSLSNNSVRTIFEDRFGTLWIGTDGGGVNTFNREDEVFVRYLNNPNDPSSLSDNWVRSIDEDNSGSLWIGTLGGGVNQVVRSTDQFTSDEIISDDPLILTNNLIWSIYKDKQGVVWLGTHGGGLARFDRDSSEYIHYQNNPYNPASLGYNVVRSVIEDSLGYLWVGTEGGGLDLFDKKNESFTHFQSDLNDPNSLSANEVLVVYEDRVGDIWVGTSSGLDKFNRSTGGFSHYQHDPRDQSSISNDVVRSIYGDLEGNLWIGTEFGLNMFDPQKGNFTRYLPNASDTLSLSNAVVLSIYEDQSGQLWIGTYGGGLNKFDRENRTFTHYTELDGLPNDVVYGILGDDYGNLWISTNNGLSRFDPGTDSFRNFDVSDGLQSNEFNAGSYFQSQDGELFFGGVRGFNSFYPDQLHFEDNFIPPIILTSLTQSGENIKINSPVENIQKVTLHWPNNFFEFEFSALSFKYPDKKQYAYKLEGLEKDWNYVEGERRYGRYTNLPGGSYNLKIIGSNNDGVWNNDGISVEVNVVPPFWGTWWFRGILGIILLVGFLIGYRLRVKNVEAHSNELEELVKERTYELERRQQVAEGLREILVMLNSDRPINESLDYIVCQAARLTGADGAYIFRSGNSGSAAILSSCLEGEYWSSEKELLTSVGSWISGAILDMEPLVLPDLLNLTVQGPHFIKPSLENLRALLGIPLTIGGAVYGGLVLLYPERQFFSDEDIQLGFTFADHAALAIANEQLHDQAERMAVAAERNRLARDLHDSAKQKAFAALAQIGAVNGLLEVKPDAAREHLDEVESLVHEVLQELVILIQEMHPVVLRERGLVIVLQEYTFDWSNQSNIEIDLQVKGEGRLPLEVEQSLYRITQEALANVSRHSEASNVQVSLDIQSKDILLKITDNGRGFDLQKTHMGLGLRSMRERVEIFHGDLSVESTIGEGTKITASIHLPVRPLEAG